MSQQVGVRCVIMRGGTSKGLFFHESDLPADRETRDRFLLAAMGSPDPRQIDGLGGTFSTTSKVAILSVARRPDIDVDYTFAQVSVTQALVDYVGNCGNISSAVGPFAVDEGLVSPAEPLTVVRILNTNTNKVIEAEVPVVDGQAAVEGDCRIAGVPGAGARIRLGFVDPGGSVTGKLLPTGRARDVLHVPGLGDFEASLVDAANPAVFVRAGDLGLTGVESAEALDAMPGLLDKLERLRGAAAQMMGLVEDAARATHLSPAVPKIAVVAPPAGYTTPTGETVRAEDVDLVARIQSLQRTHRAYALTGAIATAAAAGVPGSIVAEALGGAAGQQFRLGHPGGTMNLEVVTARENGSTHLVKVVAERTARRLMEGQVLAPRRVWQAAAAVAA